ncbi:hypothetical protein LWI29_018407 [Acer saccharum]|uniref:CCHC-type domain-containing protein n=1 Tax=Acer saccharum TaxID=4024 RepID=A0AA39SM03_ACESA|nr:hypothetical protein LWI29_018407 [Acer saccharum]
MSSSNNEKETTATGTVVPVVPITSLPVATTPHHGEKPEKFKGNDFKRWQQKMLFYLTTLNLAKFLKEDAPKPGTSKEEATAVDAWHHADYICKNHILNGLDDALYNVYSPIKTAKALWESLDKKYKTEDAGMKKFIVGRFLDYKMIDNKTVISQVQELQLILHEIHAENMVLSESFQVAAVIEKLPPSWKEFKNYLKHKRKEMGLEDMIVRLRIEEDNRRSEKRGSSIEAKAHIVEKGPNKKRKHSGDGSSQGNSKKTKEFKGKCFNCNKTGHRAKDCRSGKGKSNSKKKGKAYEANMTEEYMITYQSVCSCL